MSASPVHSGPSGSRVFASACAVLGLIAVGQAVAVAFVGQRPAAAQPSVVAESPLASGLSEKIPAPEVEPSTPEAEAPLDPFAAAERPGEDPHPEMAVPAGAPPPGEDPAMALVAENAIAEPVLALPPPAALDVPITNAECLKHLDEGVYLRETQGDTLTALKHLQEALRLVPDHPKLLYQVALTYDIMGLENKALLEWRVLRSLGEEAGNYYQLALTRLKEANPALLAAAEEAADSAEEEPERRFVVAGVTTKRLETVPGAEALEFHVTVEHRGDGPVRMDESEDSLALVIHFFDEVNGRSIDRTSAQTPELSSADGLIDWADNKEEFVFEYRQAPMSPEEVMNLGPRKYFGYAIELFYENHLQDVSAEPAQLAQFAREIPVSEPGAGTGGPGAEPPLLMPGDMAPSLFPPEPLR